MNKDILTLAREAQMPFYWRTGEITYLDKLKRFAELVRADERNATLEEIAKWLENERDAPYWAELVRARSNT